MVGGTDGVGPVVHVVDKPVWHAEWKKPVFSKGETMCIADEYPLGHTRQARYIRGKQNWVRRLYLPRQRLYTVYSQGSTGGDKRRE
ncbi:hypothetical protein [Cryobacterium sp. Y50]|uniref:hypothetical protein n=1 Tax=Cryobacterium sp. Y50 TaxID=2048286 RepID=UPI00351878FA